MRLFLHIPKCAGTSIKEILENQCSNNLSLDYDSYFRLPKPERAKKILHSLENPTAVDDSHVVYGHFFPVKYIGDRKPINLTLVTILRDPLSRLISHYEFWNNRDFSDHYLWRKMKENSWTLSQFIMSDEMRNFYSQYFSQCPLQLFSYIGIYENLIESTNECLTALRLNGNLVSIPHSNKTPNKLFENLSHNFLKEAQDFHSDDYLIYNYALKKFNPHIKPTPPQL